jgi:hypothetical protein
MKMSPKNFEAFCEQQFPSAAAEWHDLKSRLFLDEGSSSVRVEAYRLQESQPWIGIDSKPKSTTKLQQGEDLPMTAHQQQRVKKQRPWPGLVNCL